MAQPIHLYGHGYSPNPIKVAMILEELGLKYTVERVPNKKAEWYTKINPNGRCPSIKDPNTDVTIWESGACIEYLLATYDKENKLQYTTSPETWTTKSWLFFQVSGQGPYFGQSGWFQYLHSEKLPSAIDRYNNEIKRVTKVIDTQLKENGSEYLVGNKCTYADIAFVSYYELTQRIFMPDWDFKSEFPAFAAWYERLMNRPAVRAAFARKELQERLVEDEVLTGEQTFVQDEYYAKMEGKEAQLAQ